jgi:hypothetical protein
MKKQTAKAQRRKGNPLKVGFPTAGLSTLVAQTAIELKFFASLRLCGYRF